MKDSPLTDPPRPESTLRDFKPLHITEAKKIAERIGADAVVIFGFQRRDGLRGELWEDKGAMHSRRRMDGRPGS